MNNKSDVYPRVDAIALLMKDHEEVKNQFDQFAQLGPRAHSSKKRLADKICKALNAHTMIEEEIFYPAVKEAGMEEKMLIEKALVEHDCAKKLIAKIQAMQPEDALFDASVKVLNDQIVHHIEEEERKIFPMARTAKLDMTMIGASIAQCKKDIGVD